MNGSLNPVFVESVGLIAPGLLGWAASRDVLSGASSYVTGELPPYAPELLPPNERRRATPAVRLAFRTAEDAMKGTPLAAAQLATVFGSSDGDTEVMHRINHSLTLPTRAISPTDFHNSVHNAPAGYWSIAVGSKLPSNSLAAHDATFAATLTEAVAQVAGDGISVLMAVYDTPMPYPLSEKRPLPSTFGVALVLTPEPSERTLAALSIARGAGAEARWAGAALEALRAGNPAARSLPLLELLARRAAGAAHLAAADGTLTVTLAAP